MKCKAVVLYEERRRKGSGKTYLKAIRSASAVEFSRLEGELAKAREVLDGDHDESAARFIEEYSWIERVDLEECEGSIQVEIELTEEPYMGGSLPALDITYKCDTCKMYHPAMELVFPDDAKGLQGLVQDALDRHGN